MGLTLKIGNPETRTDDWIEIGDPLGNPVRIILVRTEGNKAIVNVQGVDPRVPINRRAVADRIRFEAARGKTPERNPGPGAKPRPPTNHRSGAPVGGG